MAWRCLLGQRPRPRGSPTVCKAAGGRVRPALLLPLSQAPPCSAVPCTLSILRPAQCGPYIVNWQGHFSSRAGHSGMLHTCVRSLTSIPASRDVPPSIVIIFIISWERFRKQMIPGVPQTSLIAFSMPRFEPLLACRGPQLRCQMASLLSPARIKCLNHRYACQGSKYAEWPRQHKRQQTGTGAMFTGMSDPGFHRSLPALSRDTKHMPADLLPRQMRAI